MKCPICGTTNQCGIDKTSPCWCVQATISSTLLEQVPVDQFGKACICANCVEKSEKSSK